MRFTESRGIFRPPGRHGRGGNRTLSGSRHRGDRGERDKLFAEQTKRYSQFAAFEAKTERAIPVIILERA
jgi:hypothetical protein